MTTLAVAALLVSGALAGAVGAVTGIGGGILLVPALVLLFHADMHAAIAASLVAVVATSTATGSVYVGKGLANMRLAMSLEVATTLGGIAGGLAGGWLSARALGAVFAAAMASTAVLLVARGGAGERAAAEAAGEEALAAGGWEEPGTLAGEYVDEALRQRVRWRATRLGAGSAVAFVAGAASGLLGVGGGFLKVPAMTLFMRVPLRVAAATSNLMIGVTAAASLLVQIGRGNVEPLLAAPVALGVIGGSLAGTRMATHIAPRVVRWVLAALLLGVAAQMVVRAAGGRFGT